MSAEIRAGDCRDTMRALEPDSIDAIVSDPPYGLSFMGKGWDKGVPGVEFWTEAVRVAKPGSYLLAFGGTRTFHRLTCAIEDAGFEIHDCLSWLYGSGFPKHKSKLKPAWEPIILARKPAAKATPLNIDACRIAGPSTVRDNRARSGYHSGQIGSPAPLGAEYTTGSTSGRWPANVVLDEEAAAALDEQTGNVGGGFGVRGASSRIYGNGQGFTEATGEAVGYGDSGGASRFFYCAKASRSEREAGLEGFEERNTQRLNPGRNHHPTVKPVALMRWLIRLVTPPNGLVLDPFAGSGTTGVACVHEGRRFIGCELSDDYAAIARARIAHAVETVEPSLAVA